MAQPRTDTQAMTRRRFVTLGAALGLTTLASVPGVTRSTPVATPAVLPRPELLVDAPWLQEHLDDPSLVIVGLTPAEEFAASHIPHAVQVDWPAFELVQTSDDAIAAWEAILATSLGNLGIAPDRDVVVYDDGTLFAARLWWIMEYLGHRRVRVLNGGLPAWLEAGGEVESGEVVADAATPYDGMPDPRLLAQIGEVLARLEDPGTVIIDARASDEFASGHIPGAVNISYLANARDGSPPFLKPATALLAMYEAFGVTPDKLIIPYCTSGVRSAVTAFTLTLIGFPRVALYTGSWQEWSAHPGAPKATGDA